jgi:hypothetical protein
MNFPNATPADWTAAARIVAAAARREGYDAATADDMAQNAMLAAVRRKDDGRFEGPKHYAHATVRFCRRKGWNALRDRRQPRQPLDAARAVRRGGGLPLDPAYLAERAEGMSRADRVKVARRHCGRLLDIVHAAAGVGPLAEREPHTVPSVTDLGPGYTPPAKGCRGLHRDTDPRPAAAVQAEPLTGANLAAYRQQVAAYYAR